MKNGLRDIVKGQYGREGASRQDGQASRGKSQNGKNRPKKGGTRYAPPKKRRRRKRNLSLYYLMILILAAVVGGVLSLTVFFNIQHIEVTGESRYTSDEIIAASGIQAGDNLIRSDFQTARETILHDLVYIEDVSITRSFPDTAVIAVESSVPAANIAAGGGYLLISQKGKILEKTAAPQKDLLLFQGVTPLSSEPGEAFSSEDEAKQKLVGQFCQIVQDLDMERISWIDLTDRFNLVWMYDNRITVKLGSAADLEYKMRYAQKLIAQNIPKNREGTLTMLGNNEASWITKEDFEKYEDNISRQTQTFSSGTGILESESGQNTESSAQPGSGP